MEFTGRTAPIYVLAIVEDEERMRWKEIEISINRYTIERMKEEYEEKYTKQKHIIIEGKMHEVFDRENGMFMSFVNIDDVPTADETFEEKMAHRNDNFKMPLVIFDGIDKYLSN